MFAKIYKEIKARIINSKDDLCFYLKMSVTYWPLFVWCIALNVMCYGVFSSIVSLNFNIQIIGPLTLFLIVLLSIRMYALEERHKINKLK